jgi:gliding motility-associated-like protein
LFLVDLQDLPAGTYTIYVRDVYGCEIAIDYEIGYDNTVFIPNVFTPNDDGFNDAFYIRNLPESGTQIVITNRTGVSVFKTDNYTTDNLWDGGDEADGIYFYSVKMPNGDTYKGWVELWREVRP